MSRDLEYEKNNIGYDYQYQIEDGGGIKCKNYEICSAILPEWWFDCKGNYLCTNCDMLFGKFQVLDNLECPICLEKKRSVKQTKCDHTICIDCFKRCWNLNYEECQPVFPYPEIMDEWELDQDNPKWYAEYPLIKKYDEEWELWNTEDENREENEGNLRKCPICRS